MKFRIEYTSTYNDIDYCYPDMSDIVLEANSREDAIVRFRELFPNDLLNQYHIDVVHAIPEVEHD